MNEHLTVDQAVVAMARWLQIRQQWTPHAGAVNSATVDHSALLRRLLSGKEPLPTPPPRACSYPWYDLMDEGRADHVMAESLSLGSMMINQYLWQVIERQTEDEYIVICEAVSGPYRLWRDPPPAWSESARKNRHVGWKIARMEQPS